MIYRRGFGNTKLASLWTGFYSHIPQGEKKGRRFPRVLLEGSFNRSPSSPEGDTSATVSPVLCGARLFPLSFHETWKLKFLLRSICK